MSWPAACVLMCAAGSILGIIALGAPRPDRSKARDPALIETCVQHRPSQRVLVESVP